MVTQLISWPIRFVIWRVVSSESIISPIRFTHKDVYNVSKGISTRRGMYVPLHSKSDIQQYLSIADTLYSGQLAIADKKLWPRQNSYTLHIINPLHRGHGYSGHLVLANIHFGPFFCISSNRVKNAFWGWMTHFHDGKFKKVLHPPVPHTWFNETIKTSVYTCTKFFF